MRESLRRAVEHGVLVADQATGSFRFRHALLAEAIYATILPGEREELHARLADELARSGAAAPAELAPHWAAAGRSAEALVASVEAAREAEAVFGLAEALAHLERALALWDAVPDAAELVGLDLAELCARAQSSPARSARPRARSSSRGGRSSSSARATRTARRSCTCASASTSTRAAATTLASPRSSARSSSSRRSRRRPSARTRWGRSPAALMLAWRHRGVAGDLPSRRSRSRGPSAHARQRSGRSTCVGGDLAYLGRAEEGSRICGERLQLAEEIGDHWGLDRAYVNLTDALTMLGRPRESARLGQDGARGDAPLRHRQHRARRQPASRR